MVGLHKPSLNGSTMIEKTASVHWEGPGKRGQGQSAPWCQPPVFRWT